MFYKYKNLLGEPKKGIHSYRFLHMAIADILMTILGAAAINYFLPKYSFISILIALFITGIILHRMFCVKTTIDTLLFE